MRSRSLQARTLLAVGVIAMVACAPRSAPVTSVPLPDGDRVAGVTDGAVVSPRPAEMPDVPDRAPLAVLHSVDGEATYYADYFDGRQTASGAIFRQREMTAAHRDFPFGTLVRVTNLRNERQVMLVITDRGPFGERAMQRNRIIDLSRRAAEELDFIRAGWTPVRVEVLEWGDGRRVRP